MFPQGLGILFSRSTRVRLILVIAGYVVLSLLDTIGVASMVPLMTVLNGGDYKKGIVGSLWVALGSPSAAAFTQYIAIIAVSAFLLKALFGVASRWWSLGFLMKQQNETAIGLMRSYLRAPYELHRERNTTEFIEMIKTTTLSTYSAVSASLAFVAELATILAVSATLIVVDPVLALVALAFFGLLGTIFQIAIRNRSRHLGGQMIAASIASTKAIMHGFGGIKEVKLRNNPTPFVAEFAGAQRELTSAQRTNVLFGELPKYFFEILFVSGIALLSVVMFSQRESGQALGALAMFGAAGFRLLPSATRMLASLNGARLGRTATEKLVAELTLVKELNSTPPTRGLLSYTGDIVIKDVDFSYRQETKILKNINLTIPRGSSLAVVGASGAGKTTLVDLLLGLQEPESGSISCGGLSIYDSLGDWQSLVGFVPQDVFLMDASLQENIVFDERESDVNIDRLNDAIRRSQLDDLVAASPEGLDVRVGDRGVKLSGGQRQRVGIARALYRQPAVLLLDEATSALDNETERRITETIDALGGEVTVIVVAHRLSTVKSCDQFVMLNAGRVEAAGSFSAVVENSPSFAEMVRLASLDLS